LGEATSQQWCNFQQKKAHLDAVKDLGVEEVDTGVDPVSDEFDGLLDESVNNGRVGLGDDDTVVGRLGDFGDLFVSGVYV
jgi:hypothetical protein